ncbi:MAG: STT3 domain-containing protein [Nanoarchaeota archaeon]|nr:STT3 domain-containing protein [Nanoarchaeota archaeon]
MENPQENSEQIIRERKEKIVNFFKRSPNWIFYLILAGIAWLSVRIRTINIPGLKDISTGTWTLGPDLDPFLFLRWAKYMVEHGSLFAMDTLRYVPLGYDTVEELKMVSWAIVGVYKILLILPDFLISLLPGAPSEITVTYAAILMPVVFFAFTVVAFFFLTQRIFIDKLGRKNASIIALIASFFLTVMPSLLPRTVAGIPEKESIAFLFLFLAFYFFLSAWKSKNSKQKNIFAVLAGFSTAGMALTWGGYGYIFLVLSISIFIAFFLGQIKKDKIIILIIWLATTIAIMLPATTRYGVKGLLTSIATGSTFFILGVILIHELIFNTKIKDSIYNSKLKTNKIPKQVFSFLVVLIIAGILITLFDASFIPRRAGDVINNLVSPAQSRLIQTVAENRQPYFKEWSGNFGPLLRGNPLLPVFFWLFFIGSIYLLNKTISKFKFEEKLILTLTYIFFLIAVIFSRYAPDGYFNGTNNASLIFYGLGFLVLICAFGYYYYKYYFSDERKKLKKISFEYIFLLSFFFFGVISARGAVRLIMVLAPSASIIVSYFLVSLFNRARGAKDETVKLFLWILVIIFVLAALNSGIYFYKVNMNQAKNHVPSGYTNQWQNAMGWVREETPVDSVFGHWWDYGYWLQSIGERATILDGGNSISYWNHLMGREVLTSPNDSTALEFLYAHNTTHYLIDSTEIGKYSAYSKIGGDVNRDRESYIPTIQRDERQTQETNEGFVYVYIAGIPLDEDIIWNNNGSEQIFPKEISGIIAFLIEEKNEVFLQAQAIMVKQGNQIKVPLKYIYVNGELIEFDEGIEAGIFLIDEIVQENGQVGKNPNAKGFYLSSRTINSFMVRKYLFEEEGDFNLVHNEPNLITASLRSQGFPIGDFAYFQGNFIGPIKIWEINYPSSIQFNQDYLETDYPEELKVG